MSCRLLHALGIPLTALLSVVFGLFLASFPLGMLAVFEYGLGGDIDYRYPLTHLDAFSGTDVYRAPAGITVGDAFVALWALYAVVFVVCAMGPRRGFIRSLSDLVSHGRYDPHSSYMMGVARWFSVAVLMSVVVAYVQGAFGIEIVPPPAENDMVQFFYVTLAPAVEELGFRMLLLGVPLFALYSARASLRHFVRCLWMPHNLHIASYRKAAALVIVVSALFGLAHVATGEGWSEGKFAQASAGGLILGWVYIRYGFAASLMVHWATNYFIFAYATFVSQANEVPVEAAFAHPLISSMEAILVASGIVSVAVMALCRFRRNSEVQGGL